MKIQILALLAVLALTVSCSKDIDPEGPITIVEKNVSGFSSIESNNGLAISITLGDEEKVTVETYENVQPYIHVYQAGTNLHIELKEDTEFEHDPQITIRVSAKAIAGITASGGSKITVDNTFDTDNLNTVLTGGSSLSANLQCSKFTSDLSGGSKLNLQGKSDSYSLTSSGGSTSNGFAFVVNDFHCDLSGGSTVNVTVNNELNVIASGGSVVNYKGSGIVASQVLSGGSSVYKK